MEFTDRRYTSKYLEGWVFMSIKKYRKQRPVILYMQRNLIYIKIIGKHLRKLGGSFKLHILVGCTSKCRKS